MGYKAEDYAGIVSKLGPQPQQHKGTYRTFDKDAGPLTELSVYALHKNLKRDILWSGKRIRGIPREYVVTRSLPVWSRAILLWIRGGLRSLAEALSDISECNCIKYLDREST